MKLVKTTALHRGLYASLTIVFTLAFVTCQHTAAQSPDATREATAEVTAVKEAPPNQDGQTAQGKAAERIDAADDQSLGMPLVFEEDFERDASRWETTDDTAWSHHAVKGGNAKANNHVFGLTRRKSNYEPKVRSPHNIALIKDIELEDFVLIYRVRSTNDTGNHRDCCTFFCRQNEQQFYYVHLGAKPDQASGQIMIVNDEPRRPLTDNKKLVAWDDEWHTVKVVRDGQAGTIKVYFDDMEKVHMQATDKTFGRGRIGIGSFDDMNDFDDIRLYGR